MPKLVDTLYVAKLNTHQLHIFLCTNYPLFLVERLEENYCLASRELQEQGFTYLGFWL